MFLKIKTIVFLVALLPLSMQEMLKGECMPTKKKDSLKAYRTRREFKTTPEPRGRVVKKRGKKALFVIQHHMASHDHYDFRLEIEGVLKSWAIPKGPSLDPDVKHLAVETENHPMQYAKFEGTIPQGEYGGGTVMVWDIGTYDNLKAEYDISMHQSYTEGKIEIFLHGKKLQGAFALIRTRLNDNKKNWLFFKMDDEYASKKKNPVTSKKKSALTDRSMTQIAKAQKGKKVWRSNRKSSS